MEYSHIIITALLVGAPLTPMLAFHLIMNGSAETAKWLAAIIAVVGMFAHFGAFAS